MISKGCSNCLIVLGYKCDSQKCTPICGDGIILEGETCDDGNMNTFDGCSNCLIEDEYWCEGTPSICFKKWCEETFKS